MKALDYFNKCEKDMVNADESVVMKAISQFIIELSTESQAVIKARNCKTTSGIVNVIKEFNQKYNAVCALFEKKYGASPIITNGFQEYWCQEIPELRKYLSLKQSSVV